MPKWINISQKKTCNGCRAYCGTVSTPYCELGYPIDLKAFDALGFTQFGIPKVPCPKPRNYSQFNECHDLYQFKHIGDLKNGN